MQSPTPDKPSSPPTSEVFQVIHDDLLLRWNNCRNKRDCKRLRKYIDEIIPQEAWDFLGVRLRIRPNPAASSSQKSTGSSSNPQRRPRTPSTLVDEELTVEDLALKNANLLDQLVKENAELEVVQDQIIQQVQKDLLNNIHCTKVD